MKVQRDYLPDSGGWWWWGWPYGAVYPGQGGQLMMKPGDEQWALLPYNDSTGTTNLLPGTYYVLVGSQGQNLVNNCEGNGSASYTLDSWAEPPTVLPDALSYGNDLVLTNAQAGGEMKFYQFNVPAGIASIEVRLENRVGNPRMTLNCGHESGDTRLRHLRQLWRNEQPMEQWQPDHDPQSVNRALTA